MRRAPIPKPVQIPAQIRGQKHARIQQAAHTRLLQVMIAPLRVARMIALPRVARMIATLRTTHMAVRKRITAQTAAHTVRTAQEIATGAWKSRYVQAILTAAAHKPGGALPQAARRFTARSMAREQTADIRLIRIRIAAQAKSVVQAGSAAPIPRHIPAQNTEAVQRAAASLNRAR